MICDNILIREAISYSFNLLTRHKRNFIVQENHNELHTITPKEIYCFIISLDVQNLNIINELKKIKNHFNVPIYLISFLNSPIIENQCLLNGVDYYFSSKRDSLFKILEVIENHRQITVRKNKNKREKIPTLSNREIEVLKLVMTGQTSKMIAHELKIGVRTVDTFKSRLQKKLNKPLSGYCLH